MFFFQLEEGCGQPSNQCSVSSQLVEQSNAVFVYGFLYSRLRFQQHLTSGHACSPSISVHFIGFTQSINAYPSLHQ